MNDRIALPARVALGLLFGAVVAACGGSGGGTAGAAPVPPPAPSQPPALATCDGLARMPLNTWEDSEPAGWGQHWVQTDPFKPGSVYMGADYADGMFDDGRGRGVQKSDDCGATWRKASTGTGDAELQTGRLWQIVFHPRRQGTLYVTIGYGLTALFKSEDGGTNWRNVSPKAGVNLTAGSYDPGTTFISGLMLDPQDPDHQFLTYHTDCGTKGGCLAETHDAGASWTVLTRDNPKFASEVRGYPLGGPLLAVNQYGMDSSGQAVGWMDLSEDGGKTFRKVSDAAVGGHDWQPVYHAANGYHYLAGVWTLLKVSADGKTWKQVFPGQSTVSHVVGDANKLFVLTANGLYTSPVSDGENWTLVTDQVRYYQHGPTIDPVNKLLYVDAWTHLYRLRYE